MRKQMKQGIMDYAQFCEEIFRRLREDEELNLNNVRMTLFTNGCICQCAEDSKLIKRLNQQYYQIKSDVVRGDWTIIYKNDGTVCEIPLTQLYQLHRHLGGDMKLVWCEVCNALNSSSKSRKYTWLRGIWEYERMKEHLVMRMVPLRKSTCDGCIGFTHGDMAIVLCDISERDEEKSRVQQDSLGYWCKDETEVFRETFNHMLDQYIPDIDMTLDDNITGINYDKLHLYTDINNPITISDKENVLGAIMLYCPGVQQATSAMIGFGNFYSIMPTIDKALIYPASRVTEQQVREKLREILQETPEDKILSRQVCYYDNKCNYLKVL